MAKLLYTTHQGQRQEVELGPSQPVVVVGRMADCQVRTVDTSVSRKHSQFIWTGGPQGEIVEVEDLGSSNGTFVNDQPTSGRVSLNDNDQVRCGNFALSFQSPPVAAGRPDQYRPDPGRSVGPPQSGAPTRFGPSASGLGAAGGGQAAPPYLDDPSIAVPPEHIADQFSHLETVGPGGGVSSVPAQRPGPPPGAGVGPPPQQSFRPPQQHNIPAGMGPGEMRTELDQALRRADALAREIDELRYDNSRLRSKGGGGVDSAELRRMKDDLRRAREDAEEAREESAELRRDESRGKAQMDALSDRNNELKEQYTALQEQQSELRDKLREAREDLDNALFKRDELSVDVERLEADKVEIFDQLTKLKIEYNHLERANEQIKKDYGLQEYEFKRLVEEQEEMERQLHSTLEGGSKQEDALRHLQEMAEEKDHKLDELKERVAELRDELEEQNAADSSWMVEVETLKRENEELKEIRDELKSRLEEAQESDSASRASQVAEEEAKDEELESLQAEVDRLRRRAKDRVAVETYEAVQGENEELHLELRKVNAELEEAKSRTPAGAGELLKQIRDLTAKNHRLETKLREESSAVKTSPGDHPSLAPAAKEKATEVHKKLNGMVSTWRANLETGQIHVADLSGFFETLGEIGYAAMGDAGEDVKKAVDDADPAWVCENLNDTVRSILSDSKEIKSLLLELRDALRT